MPRPKHIGPYKRYLRDPDAPVPRTTAWIRQREKMLYGNTQVLCVHIYVASFVQYILSTLLTTFQFLESLLKASPNNHVCFVPIQTSKIGLSPSEDTSSYLTDAASSSCSFSPPNTSGMKVLFSCQILSCSFCYHSH